MRPTSREIIESIIAAIDSTILPGIEEKQAASSVRAARTLLEHLAVRVETEHAVIAADNEDARNTLMGVGEVMPMSEPVGIYEIALLQAENEGYHRRIDEVLRALPRAGQETGKNQIETRVTIRAYLERHLARERAMIIPAFLGPPF